MTLPIESSHLFFKSSEILDQEYLRKSCRQSLDATNPISPHRAADQAIVFLPKKSVKAPKFRRDFSFSISSRTVSVKKRCRKVKPKLQLIVSGSPAAILRKRQRQASNYQPRILRRRSTVQKESKHDYFSMIPLTSWSIAQ